MSVEYDVYLTNHIGSVKHAWAWMQDNLLCRIGPQIREWYQDDEFDPIDIFEINILTDTHDQSKRDPDEYYAYDAYFYGGNKSHQVVENFNRAFLYHIHRNPHHWQYWILTHDDPDEPTEAIEMPLSYIFELICDWWSFSLCKEKPMEIFNWWEEHKDHIKMNKKTRKTVNYILEEMKKVLTEQGEHEDEHLAHKETDISEEEDKNKYGVPELKKFPMPDADHVKSAIRFFNYIDPKHEKELAEAILERMDEYKMSFDDFGVGDENRFKNYISKKERPKVEE